MSAITCPFCGLETLVKSRACQHCNEPVQSVSVSPIRKLSGKFSAAGAIVIAIGVVGTVMGGWWGPAVMLPGLVLMMLAKFL